MIGSPPNCLALLVICFVLVVSFRRCLLHHHHCQLPPGPSKLPVIGNLHQFRRDKPWLWFHELAREYGDIFSLRFGPTTLIVLGSQEAAQDLLVKRSHIYSSRPSMAMAQDCVTHGLHVLVAPYGREWRDMHRTQVFCYGNRAAPAYHHIQDFESTQTLLEILSGMPHLRAFHRYAANVMHTIGYGRRCASSDDSELKVADHIVQNLIKAIGPWIVNICPTLNKLPQVLAPWKRTGETWYQAESSWHLRNFENALSERAESCAKMVMRDPSRRRRSRLQLAYDVGIVLEAGVDTTRATLGWFALAISLYPDVLKKARYEIDEEVGPDRLPTFADRTRLPYTQALVKEVLRWRPVIAGGIPHCVTQDDNYRGYHIPRGSTVIGNHWSIMQDEKLFDVPREFRPERWLQDQNLPWCPFGFGRRICVGQDLAMDSLFIAVVRLMWAFEFIPISKDGGSPNLDDMESMGTFSVHPQPFELEIVPRTEAHEISLLKAAKIAN